MFGNSKIFAADPPKTPVNNPVVATQPLKYSDYTYSYCANSCGYAPNPTAVAAANKLGLTIKSNARGEEGNISGPGGKVVASGKTASDKWLQNELAKKDQQQKIPDEFCVLITPGQSKDYGNKNVWGEHGVYKYKDPGDFPNSTLGRRKYDAYGLPASKEESEINFKLRTGGQRKGGDEDPSSYGKVDINVPSIDSAESNYGLGYLDKAAMDVANGYAQRYASVKMETAGNDASLSNEEIALKISVPKNIVSGVSQEPKKQSIRPNEAQATEYVGLYSQDKTKAGFKQGGTKVMRPGPYPKDALTYSTAVSPIILNSSQVAATPKQDTTITKACEFRDPSPEEMQRLGGFPSTTPPGGSEGWPSSGNNGGGGGGGGGSMDDMMKLLEALKGMGGQGGGGNQQPKSSPSAQPFYCPATIAEVCGEDGNTYGNACIAEQENGITVAYEGACDLNRNEDSIMNNAAELMRSAIASGIPKNLLEAITLSISKLIAQMLQGQFMPVTNIGQ